MILGRNIFGQLVYGNGEPICRPCWNGFHHMCLVQADEFNTCACSKWSMTKAEHVKGCAERKRQTPRALPPQQNRADRRRRKQ